MDELVMQTGYNVLKNFQMNLVDMMVDEVAEEMADKKAIAEHPGLVEVINTSHQKASEYLIGDILDDFADE